MNEKIFFPEPIRPLKQKTIKKQESFSHDQFETKFEDLLQKQIKTDQELKFSKHAQQRLNMRNIILSPQSVNKLNSAVEKARAKGAKDSLILMDDLAFVVSIKNNTVITAIDGLSIRENVFTNIDSAVII